MSDQTAESQYELNIYLEHLKIQSEQIIEGSTTPFPHFLLACFQDVIPKKTTPMLIQLRLIKVSSLFYLNKSLGSTYFSVSLILLSVSSITMVLLVSGKHSVLNSMNSGYGESQLSCHFSR